MDWLCLTVTKVNVAVHMVQALLVSAYVNAFSQDQTNELTPTVFETKLSIYPDKSAGFQPGRH